MSNKLPDRNPDAIKKWQLTNLTENNNKWYTLRWWKAEEIAEITYGRVGQSCARPAIKENINQRKFDKLCADREKPKEEGQYKEIKTGVQQVIKADTSGLSDKLVQRITTIFRAANESIDSYLNTSISDLAPEQIAKGKLQLQTIQSAYNNYKKSNKNIDELVESARSYFEIIPTKLPSKINAANVAISLGQNLADEEDKLEALSAALTGYKISTAGGSLLDQLGCKIEEASDTEFKFAEKYFLDTRKHAEFRHLNVKEVWRVEIPQERKDFLENPVQTNIKTLWHGTKSQYSRNILRTGLLKPKISGYSRLFGYGIYLADIATKSVNYCDGHGERYLFLVDAALGKAYNTDSYLDWTEMKSGYDSVFAEAGRPIRGSYNSYLNYNEFILFNEKQQTIKYMVIVK